MCRRHLNSQFVCFQHFIFKYLQNIPHTQTHIQTEITWKLIDWLFPRQRGDILLFHICKAFPFGYNEPFAYRKYVCALVSTIEKMCETLSVIPIVFLLSLWISSFADVIRFFFFFYNTFRSSPPSLIYWAFGNLGFEMFCVARRFLFWRELNWDLHTNNRRAEKPKNKNDKVIWSI